MKKHGKKFVLVGVIVALSLVISACTDTKKDSSQDQTQRVTEEYSDSALQEVPYPLDEMRAGGWLERRNLRERLIRYADANKISYIYLLSEQGQLIASYTVKGKVSNTSSQMTTSQVVRDCGNSCDLAIEAPMDDATWGPSEDAIFFYTTDGVMVQWTGQYVLADAPLNITSTPVLVYSEGSKPSSVGDSTLYGGQ